MAQNKSRKPKGYKGGRPAKPTRSASTRDILVRENDISWYTRYPQLINSAASLYFNHRYGHCEDTVALSGDVDYSYGTTSTPGLVKANFWPMYAESADKASAVNVAAKNLYTYIRHANSGSTNYESSDVIQYLILVMNLYVRIENVKRLIRLVSSYSPVNAYTGKMIATSIYGSESYTKVISDPAQYITALNVIIAKMMSFKIPKDISILDRHLWMISNMFRDDELEKHTVYAFTTNLWAEYKWSDKKVEFRELSFDIDTELAALNTEIDNLLAIEDVGIITGDILKAYKNENCRVISPIGIGEILEPAYSTEVLDQFRNATIVQPANSPQYGYGYDVMQDEIDSQNVYLHQMGSNTDTNGILHCFLSTTGEATLSGDFTYEPSLCINNNNPSVDEVVAATRLSLSLRFDSENNQLLVTDYGTEIITDIQVASIAVDYKSTLNELESVSVSTLKVIGTLDSAAETLEDLMYLMGSYTQLHKVTGCPNYTLLFAYSVDEETYYQIFNYYNGKNVTIMSQKNLKDLHTVCKLSEYSMPMFKLLEVA